jgi:integrase/recombinase XerD
MQDPTHTPATTAIVTPIYLAIATFLASYSSLNTRKLYEMEIKLFIDWCERLGLDPLTTVTRPHIELYGRHLETERGNCASTVSHRLGTLITWYRFLEIDGIVAKSPAAHVRRPKVWYDETKTLGLDRMEMGALLATARAHPQTNRWALVALMGMLGLRVSEACNVQIEDYLDREERGHRILSVVGKGNKPATMPIPVQVHRALEACRGDRTSGPLLLRVDGNQLDRQTARNWIIALAKRAGIHKKITAHSLRHAWVTNALDAGVSLRIVQDGARHSDPRTTMRYDRARGNLDRHANHVLAAYLAGSG